MFALRRTVSPIARTLVQSNKRSCFIALRNLSDGIFYSRDHEWVEVKGNVATLGITSFAQDALGDLVYVELPEVGDEFSQGSSFASVESVKAASDVYAPISGTVVEVNEALEDQPDLVNEDAEGKGWLAKLEVADTSEELDDLLTREQYEDLLAEEDGN